VFAVIEGRSRFSNAYFGFNYMKRFLESRNQTIKEFAETEKWKTILNDFENYV